MTKLFLGVDPGWKNLGWSVTDEKGRYIKSGSVDPSTLPLGSIGQYLLSQLEEEAPFLAGMAMERYVVYKGKYNSDSEHILLVTGALQALACQLGIPLDMYKAIDWKTRAAKFIYKTTRQENPSDRLDKVFSMFAALVLLEVEFESDHEADASCLSWFAGMAWRASNR